MHERYAFKTGFLWHCLKAGYGPDEAMQLVRDGLVKRAFLGSAISAAGKGLGALASGVWNLGLPAALLAPPALGAALGVGLSRLMDVSELDEKEVKKRELLELYRLHAEAARRRAVLREYRRLRDATAAWAP